MDPSPSPKASDGALRIASPGHAVFALTMIGLGLAGLATGDFSAIWQPFPKHWPAREALIWITALVSLGCGVGLLWRRASAAAAGVLAAALFAWMLAIKATVIVRAPGMAGAWESCGETAVLVAAAWALAAAFAGGRPRLGFLTGDRGLRLARGLYALAMLAFGAAHLAYVKDTAALVPGWLPAHVGWIWFTGIAYIAAGAAMLAGVLARLAAALSAAQMGVFTLLVWIPAIASGHADAGAWSEAVLSWALTAAGWVMADSYRGAAWLAVRTARKFHPHSPPPCGEGSGVGVSARDRRA